MISHGDETRTEVLKLLFVLNSKKHEISTAKEKLKC